MSVLIKLLHVGDPCFVLIVVFLEPAGRGHTKRRVYETSHQANILVSDLAPLHVHRVHRLRDWLDAVGRLRFVHNL